MVSGPSFHNTTIDIDGFERNITVALWFNEITMEVDEIDRIFLTDTDQDISFLLTDEEIIAHIFERVETESEENRRQDEFERAHSNYMDEY